MEFSEELKEQYKQLNENSAKLNRLFTQLDSRHSLTSVLWAQKKMLQFLEEEIESVGPYLGEE